MVKSLRWLMCAFAFVAFTGVTLAADDEEKDKKEDSKKESGKKEEGKKEKGDAKPSRPVPLQGAALKAFRAADKDEDKFLSEGEFGNAYNELKQSLEKRGGNKSSKPGKSKPGVPPKIGPAGGSGGGKGKPMGEASEWFSKFDTDKDKKISESEFAAGWNKAREAARGTKKSS